MLKTIRGYEDVCSQVGFSTTFHDDEVRSVLLFTDRDRKNAMLQVKVALVLETPAKGKIVSFIFEDVSDVSLNGFNHQNVLWGIDVNSTSDGLKLSFDSVFGAELSFTCQNAAMSLD